MAYVCGNEPRVGDLVECVDGPTGGWDNIDIGGRYKVTRVDGLIIHVGKDLKYSSHHFGLITRNKPEPKEPSWTEDVYLFGRLESKDFTLAMGADGVLVLGPNDSTVFNADQLETLSAMCLRAAELLRGQE